MCIHTTPHVYTHRSDVYAHHSDVYTNRSEVYTPGNPLSLWGVLHYCSCDAATFEAAVVAERAEKMSEKKKSDPPPKRQKKAEEPQVEVHAEADGESSESPDLLHAFATQWILDSGVYTNLPCATTTTTTTTQSHHHQHHHHHKRLEYMMHGSEEEGCESRGEYPRIHQYVTPPRPPPTRAVLHNHPCERRIPRGAT